MKPDQIRRLRHNIYHLSQHEFAEVMGTCVATISRWEAGRTKPIGMAKVILEAAQLAVENYGEQRIRGVDWSALLEQHSLLKVLAGILNFATTRPLPPEPPGDDPEPMI
jgi:transcriptional regulator with XRE-family HTH domain